MSCFCHLKPVSKDKKCECPSHYVCSLCGTCYQCDHEAVYSKFQNQWYWQHPTKIRTKAIGVDAGQDFI